MLDHLEIMIYFIPRWRHTVFERKYQQCMHRPLWCPKFELEKRKMRKFELKEISTYWQIITYFHNLQFQLFSMWVASRMFKSKSLQDAISKIKTGYRRFYFWNVYYC